VRSIAIAPPVVVERVVFNDKRWGIRSETFLAELKQRMRDVRQGPDGLIYLLTEETEGAVLKIEPDSGDQMPIEPR
jgi:glucose/arabinose dehydrogenase